MTMPFLENDEHKKIFLLLHELGEKIGLAFQIMDDVLEVSSDSKTLGKSNVSDIENNKMTYVSVYGLEQSIVKAETLSNYCISKIQDNFPPDQAKELIELTKFMVTRAH